MARVIFTPAASRGLHRCRALLQDKNPIASRRAADAIQRQLHYLAAYPESGRPYLRAPRWREMLIPFGESGYIVLYDYDAIEGVVYLLAFRHQREAGY